MVRVARWGIGVLVALPLCLAAAVGWSASPRLALVLGNASYREQDDWRPLPNIRNDVREMRKLLAGLGFRLLPAREQDSLDLSRAAMEDAVLAMKDALAGGDGGEVALVYFTGHGLGIRGRNYLIPIGARIDREEKADSAAYSVERIISEIGSAPGRLNLFLIDACRSDPSVKGGAAWKGAGDGNGFAPFGARTGTLIGYAAEPGTLANGGAGREGFSLYTGALLSALREPNLPLQKVLERAETLVTQQTKGSQVPHVEGRVSLLNWVINPAPSSDAGPVGRSVMPAPERREEETRSQDPKIIRGTFFVNSIYFDLTLREVKEDEAEVVRFYRDSAQDGNANSQRILGWMLANGYGVVKDEMEAVRWYRKSARQGDADAQVSLGWMLATGHGVAKDEEEAVYWYQQAARQGHSIAEMNLPGLAR